MTADELVLGSPAVAESDSKKTAGPLKQLWWRLCLKPYGDALCTPGASFWIFSARIAIFIMASAEAISWSYLGYYIGQSSQPYVTAALAGIAIFSVIWIVDASFITLDTSRARDEAALYGRESNRKAENVKLGAGLLIRGFIISATLVISAPFLAQLVFYRDISAEMSRRDATLIANKRAEVAASYDARVAGLLQLRARLEDASIAEAAGTGASRQIGRGPAVATIEKRLDEIDRQILATRVEKENGLRAFDGLSWPELQKTYGIEFSEDGIRARGEILERLSMNSTYANAELAIRGFLTFLFLALLVLKLFQPASVGVYFSEATQDLYGQYRRGTFDAWLAPQERSYAKSMTPLRFREWCVANYRAIREDDENQRRLGRHLAATQVKVEELTRMRRTAEAEAAPARGEYEEARGTLVSTEDSLASTQSQLAAERERLAAHERDATAIAATMGSGIAGETFARAAETHAMFLAKAAEARGRVRALEGEVSRLERQAREQKSRVDALQARAASRDAVRVRIDEQLAKVNADTTSALG